MTYLHSHLTPGMGVSSLLFHLEMAEWNSKLEAQGPDYQLGPHPEPLSSTTLKAQGKR